MPLDLVTAPATEPLTLAEVRTHLKIDGTNAEPAPTAPTAALAGAGAGNVDNGAHRYRVTFVTADGETEGGTVSDAVTVADKTVNGKVALTAIPVGGSAATSRRLWRNKIAAQNSFFLLATLADNTTTTYTDNTADASLGAGAPTTNTTGDPYLTALITTVRQRAEDLTNRALITQTWKLALNDFPDDSACQLWLPLPPLQSVTSIVYVDTAGDSQTWAASKYQVTTPAGPRAMHGGILPAYGEYWPSTREQMEAVIVTFVAGYGAAGAVPQGIKQWMLLAIGDLYEHRQSVIVGAAVTEIKGTVEGLLDPFRADRYDLRFT
ncbi:MAG: hypothetical protein HY323_07325 [Betaproteobacteria bacterium]|nr:hypothetical protein [Betaproteobacteria bacterium]